MRIIDKKRVGNKIRDFKGKRNKVSHNLYAEYSLKNTLPFKTQEEYDQVIEKESKEALKKALEIYRELIKISEKLCLKFKSLKSEDKLHWILNKKREF